MFALGSRVGEVIEGDATMGDDPHLMMKLDFFQLPQKQVGIIDIILDDKNAAEKRFHEALPGLTGLIAPHFLNSEMP
jgi:hypothetical protein